MDRKCDAYLGMQDVVKKRTAQLCRTGAPCASRTKKIVPAHKKQLPRSLFSDPLPEGDPLFLSWPPLSDLFSRALSSFCPMFAGHCSSSPFLLGSFLPFPPPSKSALYCRARGAAQSLESSNIRMDFSTKSGKETRSRNVRENRSVVFFPVFSGAFPFLPGIFLELLFSLARIS